MSWILQPHGDGGGRVAPARNSAKEASQRQDGPPDNVDEDGVSPWEKTRPENDDPLVADPVDPGRTVPAKHANQPFLSYSEYRNRRTQEHEAWQQRKEEREAKLARGEKVCPEEPDPTEEPEVGCLGLLKFILYVTLFIVLAGKFITGSFLWEHELPNLRHLIPTNQRLFSERMLATFDGTNDEKPIYLAIDGDVYDVSASRLTYGPGGPYHMLAGKDAARAYSTGCFSTHLTHDLRGLNGEELRGVENWKKFYADHKKYFKVGHVSHPPIDPASPIPEHCDPKKAKAARTPDQVEKLKRTQDKREEL